MLRSQHDPTKCLRLTAARGMIDDPERRKHTKIATRRLERRSRIAMHTKASYRAEKGSRRTCTSASLAFGRRCLQSQYM